jgi:6-pyruvoyl-tetrahydropterin synthase
MYRIATGIFISFAHHVRGHSGPCISLHGHTWKFEVALCALELDGEGFVVDFGQLRKKVLTPCHALLDHSLAMGEDTWAKNQDFLAPIGADLMGSRIDTTGGGEAQNALMGELNGARNEFPGGIKVAVFPFDPTSERLAEWLHSVASAQMEDDRVKVAAARVFESLHPVESVAEFRVEG